MDFFSGTIPACSLIPAFFPKDQDGKWSAKIQTRYPKAYGQNILTGVARCKVTMQPRQRIRFASLYAVVCVLPN